MGDDSLGLLAYLLSLSLAAVVAWVVTAMLPWTGRAWPWRPTIRRRSSTPRLGGAALYLSLLVALPLASLFSSDLSRLLSDHLRELVGLWAAGGLILLLGVADDLWVLDFKQKFLGQVAAAVLAYVAGYRIEEVAMPWGPSFSLGLADPLFSLLWLVLMANAVNLIDGKDGVAAGVCIVAAVPLALIAHDVGQVFMAVALLVMAGAALGFLPFNWPRASRELGDSGAMLLGFSLAALSMEGSRGVTGAVFISVPILALGFPILDTVLAFTRRLLDKRHPFHGDRDHIHHRLEVALGLGPRGVLLALYSLSALFGVTALVEHFLDSTLSEVVAFLIFLLAIGAVLYRLGYLGTLWHSVLVSSLRSRSPLLAPRRGGDGVSPALPLVQKPPDR